MADFTRSVLDEVSKYIQMGPVVSQFNTETALWDFIKGKSRATGGRSWLVPVRISGLAGVGNRAEGGALPTATTTDYKEHTITARYTYKPISLTNIAKAFTAGNVNAFVDAVVESTQWATKAMAVDCSRQLWGGQQGRLCVVNQNVSSSTTVAVDGPGTLYIREGQALDIGTTAELAAGTHVDATVSTRDSSTQFTTTAAVTLVDEDVVVLDGNYNIEVVGLNDIFYDGTTDLGLGAQTSIYGHTRSSETWTYPYVSTAVGNDVTVNFGIALTEARIDGGGKTKVIFTCPGVFEAIYQANQSLTRFGVPTTGAGDWTLHAGHRKMDFNGIPMIDDVQAIATGNATTDTGVAVFLDTDFLEIIHTSPPHMSCPWTPSDTYDSEFTRMAYYWGGIVCRNFRAQAAVTGITLHNTSAA